MQHDCSFVEIAYNPYGNTFSANTYIGDGSKCFMAAQTNGQLVVYKNPTGNNPTQMWQSNAAPAVPASSYTLSVSDDGSASWQDNTGKVLWSLPRIVPNNTANQFKQNTACPTTPYIMDARVPCASTTYNACYAEANGGCCWDPQLYLDLYIPCYSVNRAKWFGTPGSIPGVSKAATTGNPGQYVVVATSPVAALAVAPQPNTNQVVFMERIWEGTASTTHSYIMDTNSYGFTALHPPSEIFCAGGSMMSDGSILSMGGWKFVDDLEGVRSLAAGGDWQQNAATMNLQVPRWYPSALLLPNGQLAIIGGSPDFTPMTNQPSVEFLPNSNGAPVTLQMLVNTIGNNLYPHAYVIPADANQATATAWVFGASSSSLYNLANFNLISNLPDAPGGGFRTYPSMAPSAMLPLVAGPGNVNPSMRIIICGGSTYNGVNALNTCITTTPSAGPNANWISETMPFPRVMGEMVALPDQTYLIVSGTTRGVGGFGNADTPVMTAILYNPALAVGNRFTILATTSIARLYHNEAILLVDGRVLISGSTPNGDSNDSNDEVIYPTEKRIEAYLPPYLSNGAVAPTILSLSSSTWDYNMAYTISATIPSGVSSTVTISLITPGFSTPSNTNFSHSQFSRRECSFGSIYSKDCSGVYHSVFIHGLGSPRLGSSSATDVSVVGC